MYELYLVGEGGVQTTLGQVYELDEILKILPVDNTDPWNIDNLRALKAEEDAYIEVLLTDGQCVGIEMLESPRLKQAV